MAAYKSYKQHKERKKKKRYVLPLHRSPNLKTRIPYLNSEAPHRSWLIINNDNKSCTYIALAKLRLNSLQVFFSKIYMIQTVFIYTPITLATVFNALFSE